MNIIERLSKIKSQPLSPHTLPVLLWEAISVSWSRKNVTFTQDHPRSDVSNPTIVWKVYRRINGKDGLERNKPRLRTEIVDEDSDQLYQHYAQWQTIYYQFDVYGTSNAEADEVLNEFEEYIFHSVVLLKQAGVTEFLFSEQLEDKQIGKPDTQDIFKRTLRYKCFLEKKYVLGIDLIKQIWLQLSVGFPKEVISETVVRGSGDYDELDNKWVSDIILVANSVPQNFSTYPVSSSYLINIDFDLSVDLVKGTSKIIWNSSGKRPQPGQSYYVTYNYVYFSKRESVR